MKITTCSSRTINNNDTPYIIYYSLFTPPTQTRQDCLVLSTSAVWTQLKTRQNKNHRNWVETRQNCFVLSSIVFTLPTRTRQDKLTVLAVWTSYYSFCVSMLQEQTPLFGDCTNTKHRCWQCQLLLKTQLQSYCGQHLCTDCMLINQVSYTDHIFSLLE